MHPPNYFELLRTISNYVRTMFELCCWQRFLLEKVGAQAKVRSWRSCESGLCRAGAFHPDTWKAAAGYVEQTDCWGHCSLLILSLHGPMISKSDMWKTHRVSSMICYFIFAISFQTRTAQKATYLLCATSFIADLLLHFLKVKLS